MKQAITRTQLAELTVTQDKALYTWYKDYLIRRLGKVGEEIVLYPHEMLLRIGALIAFLDEHLPDGWYALQRDTTRKWWRVDHKYDTFCEIECEELVDVLWELTKLVLPKLEQKCSGMCDECPHKE